jgi:hypothetical protein
MTHSCLPVAVGNSSSSIHLVTIAAKLRELPPLCVTLIIQTPRDDIDATNKGRPVAEHWLSGPDTERHAEPVAQAKNHL